MRVGSAHPRLDGSSSRRPHAAALVAGDVKADGVRCKVDPAAVPEPDDRFASQPPGLSPVEMHDLGRCSSPPG
jgi:hypothetical protein